MLERTHMALIQHSSESNCWGTPIYVIERARVVLHGIDLDPASDDQFNQNVKAKWFITEEEDGLKRQWPTDCSIFLNPPGGKSGRQSKTVLFWERLIHNQYDIRHAIFVAFSLEALQTTQQCTKPIAAFPMCFPKKRMRFIDENCREGTSPSHGNVIVYVPGSMDRTKEFKEQFSDIGYVRL